jgi:Caspase domain
MYPPEWRPILGFLSVAVVLVIATPAAYAEKRVALVIGNGSYSNVGKLANPPRDAAAIENLLRRAGFDTVDIARNLGNDAMRRVLREFADKVREADIAVVFYAGHGIEVNGANYLVPVDALLKTDLAVEDETIPLDRVSQILEQARRLRLVILDACRDNPFLRNMRRTIRTRSMGHGLAKVEVLTSDTLIAFAAKAGSTADDGQGVNSPYTSALVKHLATPGLDVRLAFGRVRDEVLHTTKGRQEPIYYGSLGGAETALVPAPPTPPPSVDVDAVRVCREVEGMSNAAVLVAMTAKHKGTLAADCIAARLEQLKQIAAARTAAAKERATKAAAEAQARAKGDAKRVCTNVQSISNVAELTAMMVQHSRTPEAVECIAARIEAVEKQRLTVTVPSAPGTPVELAPPAAPLPAERLPGRPSADKPSIGADGRIHR